MYDVKELGENRMWRYLVTAHVQWWYLTTTTCICLNCQSLISLLQRPYRLNFIKCFSNILSVTKHCI